jgi:murein DD-endopeptidase MepM/ murein hydrolase activator NlpD
MGALALGVGLWMVGGVNTVALETRYRPLPAGPGPLDLNASSPPHNPVNPPVSELPQHVASTVQAPVPQQLPQGDAERESPAPGSPGPRLRVPVSGVVLDSLHDTFTDMRDGHRHEALDIPAPRGTPVMAAAEGNVVKLFKSKEGGLTVYQFDDSQTYCYYYAHLERYASGLKEGVLLRSGDVLGYVGTTGDAPKDAPHLHFAVFQLGPEKNWWQGTAIDPLPLLTGPSR